MDGAHELGAGPSAFCVSRKQVDAAHSMANEHPDSAPRIQAAIERLELELSENERAALAFVLIERLRHTRR